MEKLAHARSSDKEHITTTLDQVVEDEARTHSIENVEEILPQGGKGSDSDSREIDTVDIQCEQVLCDDDAGTVNEVNDTEGGGACTGTWGEAWGGAWGD